MTTAKRTLKRAKRPNGSPVGVFVDHAKMGAGVTPQATEKQKIPRNKPNRRIRDTNPTTINKIKRIIEMILIIIILMAILILLLGDED